MTAVVLIALPLLFLIFFQDIRTRAIWWFLPPVLFVLFVIGRRSELTVAQTVCNILFVTLMIAFIVLYTRLRFGKLENPFKAYFGLGDYLFLLALTPLFPLRGFIWFFTAGTVCVLAIHLCMLLIRKSSTIPYAGYFSLFTAFYLVADLMRPELFNALTENNG
jgi:hypothetical protein